MYPLLHRHGASEAPDELHRAASADRPLSQQPSSQGMGNGVPKPRGQHFPAASERWNTRDEAASAAESAGSTMQSPPDPHASNSHASAAPEPAAEAAPDAQAPDVRAPDVQAPDVRAPDVRAPDVRAPDVRAPDVRAPALDAEVMENLRSLAEATDISLLQEIFDAFLGDSAARLQSLREALRASDAQVLKQAAHSLNGSSSNIGARQMARLSHELEALGAADAAGFLESAARLINQLEEEFARVQIELGAELEKLAP